MNPTTVDAGAPLTPRDVVAVARLGAQVTVGEDAIERVKRASDLVESLADDPTPHYGISTGFGALASTRVPRDYRVALQHSLIRSHAASTGPRVESEVIRAMMTLRLKTMASGHTGVRPKVVLPTPICLTPGSSQSWGNMGLLAVRATSPR